MEVQIRVAVAQVASQILVGTTLEMVALESLYLGMQCQQLRLQLQQLV
jgi:hypothetical protein